MGMEKVIEWIEVGSVSRQFTEAEARTAKELLMPSEWLSRKKAAEYLGINLRTLDMKVAEGLLCKHIRGGHPMYKLKDLDNYLLSAPIIGCAKEP
ncbi:MAG: hypothetical protein WCS27_08760 [Victivallaceae bacterium]